MLMATQLHASDVDESLSQSLVDLSDQDAATLAIDSGSSHVLSNAWWQNFDLYGFAAAGFYDTGSDGSRANGGFEIKEASLFAEATVWENAAFFAELQINRLGKDDALFVRTGEVYLHFREVTVARNWKVGFKFGRIDIPFGEEYLWQDSTDNPLVTNSAAYPYGWDEGVLAYWDTGAWSWIAAVTDGTDVRSRDDNSDKAVNLKVSRQLSDAFFLSVSAMRNGDGEKSAIEFGGSHFEPVGASHASSVGASASQQIAASLFQIDAKYDFEVFGARSAYVALAGGYANQSDDSPGFDRDFRWFSVEPLVSIAPNFYLAARYSEIGTYDSTEGYHFDGKTFAGGNGAFGYDTERFRRLAIGAGWNPNPRVIVKFEIGKDWFSLIDASSASNNGRREFVSFELAAKF